MTDELTQFMLIAGALPIAGFIICYGVFSPWWKTLQGIILLVQKIATLALILFYLFMPDIEWLKITLIGVLVLLFWGMFLTLVWVQNTTKKVTRRTGTGLVPADEIYNTQPRGPKRKQRK